MPFCTKCGANVTGTFCSQCGTPAAAGAAVPPQPAMVPPYAPVPPGAPVTIRKTNPIVWVLVIVLGLFVLGGIAVAGFVAFVGHRLHQAGVSFDHGRDGGVTLHARGADGKNATVEFGGSVGKLPSWVPVYPGSEGRSKLAMRGSGENGEEGGSFVFTTSDDAAHVKSFYTDKVKNIGMKVNLDSTTPEGGMIVAVDEGSERRSLTVIIGGHSGETSVNVMYGLK
jgi:hypothetical protein